MAKLQDNLSSIIARICAVILGFFGFGCSSSDPEPDIINMYGSPTGSFEIKGEVTDENDTPVAEAEVKVLLPEVPSSLDWAISDAFSEDNGNYTLTGHYYPVDTLKVVCLPPVGSSLEPDSIFTIMKYVTDENHPEGAWYYGHAEATANFKLKRKADK